MFSWTREIHLLWLQRRGTQNPILCTIYTPSTSKALDSVSGRISTWQYQEISTSWKHAMTMSASSNHNMFWWIRETHQLWFCLVDIAITISNPLHDMKLHSLHNLRIRYRVRAYLDEAKSQPMYLPHENMTWRWVHHWIWTNRCTVSF